MVEEEEEWATARWRGNQIDGQPPMIYFKTLQLDWLMWLIASKGTFQKYVSIPDTRDWR